MLLVRVLLLDTDVVSMNLCMLHGILDKGAAYHLDLCGRLLGLHLRDDVCLIIRKSASTGKDEHEDCQGNLRHPDKAWLLVFLLVHLFSPPEKVNLLVL